MNREWITEILSCEIHGHRFTDAALGDILKESEPGIAFQVPLTTTDAADWKHSIPHRVELCSINAQMLFAAAPGAARPWVSISPLPVRTGWMAEYPHDCGFSIALPNTPALRAPCAKRPVLVIHSKKFLWWCFKVPAHVDCSPGTYFYCFHFSMI